MKYISLFFLILITTRISAESNSGPSNSSISAETNTNQTLLGNAASSSQQVGNRQSTNKFMQGSSTESKEQARSNLTDQEKQLVDNYIDQAGSNKIIKEKCIGEMRSACAGEEGERKVLGMSPTLIKMATQAYATIGALGDFLPLNKGSGEWFNKKNAEDHAKETQKSLETANDDASKKAAKEANDKAQENAKEKKGDDYCKFIPTATETIAKFTQADAVKKIDSQLNNGGESSQKETLLKAAKSHDSRSDQAQIQATGWFGGAACYALQAMSGTVATDKALIVKLGAATFLGTFYQEEVNANKQYGDKVREIANSLPGKGQCNPVTENLCYCSEDENKNDTRYCMDQIKARQIAANQSQRVTCIDNKMQADTSCSCDKTNTCFDKIYEQPSTTSLQLGLGYTNSPFKAIAAMAHGKLESSVLSGAGYSQTAAIAKKALAELSSKVLSGDGPLTLSQKEAYEAFTSKGIPANAARLMALNPPPASAIELAKTKMASLGVGVSALLPGLNGTQSNVVDFAGGNGLGTSGRKNDKKTNGIDDFIGKLNPGQKGQAITGKIIDFAEKAQRQAAQVSRTDKPLFEIISTRYQLSGLRRLEGDDSQPKAMVPPAGN